MPKAPANLRDFAALLDVVKSLRGPEGCPWDKEQTHSTLTRYAIEEAFEVAEAADSGDNAFLCEELGDLLLQVILHAEIARQAGTFDIYDVIQTLNEKMVRRHPHVFAETKVKDSTEVLRNWSIIKDLEKGRSGRADTHQSFDIPMNIPALLRSQKIGEKTKKLDFDWQNAQACWPKVEEELRELKDAMTGAAESDAIESELGDLLFSVAQLARHLGLDSEQALRKTNRRFEARFHRMQRLVAEDGKAWTSLTSPEREVYWKRAKPEYHAPRGAPR